MRRIITALVLAVSLAGLGGCVVAPAPGYYSRPAYGGYYAAPRPYYRPNRGYRRW
jgi:hypothetical protein